MATQERDDSPLARAAILPAFSQPAPASSPPASPPAAPPAAPSPSSPTPGLRLPWNRKPDAPGAEDTRTATSSGGTTDEPAATPADIGMAVAGITGLVLLLVDGLLRRTVRRRLRHPTKAQLRDFGAPVGAILARHADIKKLSPDLFDILRAGNVAGAWVNEGDLTSPAGPRVEQLVDQADEPDVAAPAAPADPAPAWAPATLAGAAGVSYMA